MTTTFLHEMNQILFPPENAEKKTGSAELPIQSDQPVAQSIPSTNSASEPAQPIKPIAQPIFPNVQSPAQPTSSVSSSQSNNSLLCSKHQTPRLFQTRQIVSPKHGK